MSLSIPVTQFPPAAVGRDLHYSPGTEAIEEKNQALPGTFEDKLSMRSRLFLNTMYI